jgi:elongation factor P
MYTSSDLRKGLKVELDGQPYIITEFQFTKPGKGQAIYTCRLKNMLTGLTVVKQYRSNEKFEKPALTESKLVYSYAEGDHYVFMDSDYAQVIIEADALGNNRYFLKEDTEVDVLFYNGRPVDVTLPTFVEMKIEQTEPGARGNTATNVMKPAVVGGGYEIPVPLFVNEGDVIRVDTRTGEYVDRVLKS